MMAKEGNSQDLAKVNGGVISKSECPISVGGLELELLRRYPRKDAEPWDRMGLLVGDPAALVTGVIVALDPTLGVIKAAKEAGANVVLTHHPVFLEPPDRFISSPEEGSVAGAVVYEAASNGIALINIHTALDVSVDARNLLPSLLSLRFESVLSPLPEDPEKGYGQLCTVRPSDDPLKLEHLAARCIAVFGSSPRLWDAGCGPLGKVAVMGGSAGSVIDDAIAAGADCLVCGELRYHQALDAVQRGLSIIGIGHDVSEFPLTALLAQAALDAGVDPKTLSIIDRTPNWITPDATRM